MVGTGFFKRLRRVTTRRPPPEPPKTDDMPAPALQPEHGVPYASWVYVGCHDWMHHVDNAVPAGVTNNSQYKRMFVGRMYFGNALVPACATCRDELFGYSSNVLMDSTWQGGYYWENYGEMLQVTRGRAEWLPTSDGDVPANAFPVGVSPTGETIYCARAKLRGQSVLGRVMRSEGTCFAMYRHNLRCEYETEEVAVKYYEVLAIE